MTNDDKDLKDIDGYENEYSINKNGDIWSKRRKRFLKASLNPKYLNVMLSVKNKKKTFLVHALVMKTFVGERPKGKEINHKDGDGKNCHLSNLEYVTHKENVRHAVAIGLHPTGIRHGKYKHGLRCGKNARN